jgi:nucleoside-diphosphate-sugar epimerase
MLSKENRPVNIGNPNEFTVLEFAHLVRELTGSKSELQFHALARRRSQTAPARHHQSARGFWAGSLKSNCKKGLTNTLAYFRERLGVS